jgi:beta-1,4-N-acetylglucosaminyltransferase
MDVAFKKIRKKGKILGESSMILVIVGLSYGFERLIKEMDNIAGKINEEVIMQIGNTEFECKNARYFRFVSGEEIEKLCEDARIIICHAGVGSILTALDHDKPVIAVPREKQYGEAVDDHQLEVAKQWDKQKKIIAVYDIKNLESVLFNTDFESLVRSKKDTTLISNLRNYISQLEK